jgi:hypothetical protein
MRIGLDGLMDFDWGREFRVLARIFHGEGSELREKDGLGDRARDSSGTFAGCHREDHR